jgi:tetratricopeptide (TPR) repeat protein
VLPEEIDREFREIRQRLEKATELAHKHSLDAAATEFELLIEMMEGLRSDDDEELMMCIQSLGDCYLGLHNYTSAASIYLRLLAAQEKARSSDPDRVVTLFKLAKANDKAGRQKNADSLYAEALQLAEDCCSEGHPLLSNILESYGRFLKRKTKQIEKSATLLERARENRAVSSPHSSDHSLEALLAQVDEGTTVNFKRVKTSDLSRLREPDAVSGQTNILRTARIPILLALILASFGTYIYFSFKRADSVAAIQLKLPKTKFSQGVFQSADGYKSLKLINEQTAELSMGDQSKKAKCMDSNQLDTLFIPKSATVFSFKQPLRDQLEDADGTILYGQVPPGVALARQIAAGANATYMSTGEYPQDMDSLAIPIDKKGIVQILYIGKEGTLAEAAAEKIIASKGLLMNEKKPLSNSAHLYYTLTLQGNSGLKAMHCYIKPFDGLGECFTGSIAGQSAFLDLSAGKDITTATVASMMPKNDLSDIGTNDAVVVLPSTPFAH